MQYISSSELHMNYTDKYLSDFYDNLEKNPDFCIEMLNNDSEFNLINKNIFCDILNQSESEKSKEILSLFLQKAQQAESIGQFRDYLGFIRINFITNNQNSTFLEKVLLENKLGFAEILRENGFQKTHDNYLTYQLQNYARFQEELKPKITRPWQPEFEQYLLDTKQGNLLLDILAFNTDMPALKEFTKEFYEFRVNKGNDFRNFDPCSNNIFHILAIKGDEELMAHFVKKSNALQLKLLIFVNDDWVYPLNLMETHNIDLIKDIESALSAEGFLSKEKSFKALIPKLKSPKDCDEKDLDFLEKFIVFCKEREFNMLSLSSDMTNTNLSFFDYVLEVKNPRISQKFFSGFSDTELQTILLREEDKKFKTLQKLYDNKDFESFDRGLKLVTSKILNQKPQNPLLFRNFLDFILHNDDLEKYKHIFSREPELSKKVDEFLKLKSEEYSMAFNYKKTTNSSLYEYILKTEKKPNLFVYKSQSESLDFLNELVNADAPSDNLVSLLFSIGEDGEAKSKIERLKSIEIKELKKLLREKSIKETDLMLMFCHCKDMDYVKSCFDFFEKLNPNLIEIDQSKEFSCIFYALAAENYDYANFLLDRFEEEKFSNSNTSTIFIASNEYDQENVEFFDKFIQRFSAKKFVDTFIENSKTLIQFNELKKEIHDKIIDKIYGGGDKFLGDKFLLKYFKNISSNYGYGGYENAHAYLKSSFDSVLTILKRKNNLDDSKESESELKECFKKFLGEYNKKNKLTRDFYFVKSLSSLYAEKFDECLTIDDPIFNKVLFKLTDNSNQYSRNSICLNPLYESFYYCNSQYYESAFQNLKNPDKFVSEKEKYKLFEEFEEEIYKLIYKLKDDYLKASYLVDNYDVGISPKLAMNFLVKFKTDFYKLKENPNPQIDDEGVRTEVIKQIKERFEKKIGSVSGEETKKLQEYFSLVSTGSLEVKTPSKDETPPSRRVETRQLSSIEFKNFLKKCDDKLREAFKKESESILSGIPNKNPEFISMCKNKMQKLEEQMKNLIKDGKINIRKGEDEILFRQTKIENINKKIKTLQEIKKLENLIYLNRANNYEEEAFEKFKEIAEIKISKDFKIKAGSIEQYEYSNTTNIKSISESLGNDYEVEFKAEEFQREFELLRQKFEANQKKCYEFFVANNKADLENQKNIFQKEIKALENEIKEIQSEKTSKGLKEPSTVSKKSGDLEPPEFPQAPQAPNVEPKPIDIPQTSPMMIKDLTQNNVNELKNLLVGEIKEFSFKTKIIDASGKESESLLIRRQDYLQDIRDYGVDLPKTYSELKGLFHENLQECLQQINSNSKISSSFKSNKKITDLLYAFTAYLMNSAGSENQVEECYKRIVSYKVDGTKDGIGHARGADLDDLKQMVAVTNKMKKLFSGEPEIYTKEFLEGSFRSVATYQSSEEISLKEDADFLGDLCKNLAQAKENSPLQRELDDNFKSEIIDFIKKRADLLRVKINASTAMGGDNDAQTNKMFRFFSDNKINEGAKKQEFKEFLDEINQHDIKASDFFKILQDPKHHQSMQTLLKTINFQPLESSLPFEDVKEKMSKKFEEINEKFITRCLEKERGKGLVR